MFYTAYMRSGLAKTYPLALLVLVGLTDPTFAADAVPDAKAAEKIAAVALKDRLGEYTFSKYTQHLNWAAVLNGDYWLAMPVPQNASGDLQQLPGWIVQIAKQNGKVMGVYLQYPAE